MLHVLMVVVLLAMLLLFLMMIVTMMMVMVLMMMMMQTCADDKHSNSVYPRADGAKRRARVLIPPGYLYPGKRTH